MKIQSVTNLVQFSDDNSVYHPVVFTKKGNHVTVCGRGNGTFVDKHCVKDSVKLCEQCRDKLVLRGLTDE